MGLIHATGLLAWYLLIFDVLVGMMLTSGMSRVTLPRSRKTQLHIVLGWAMVLAVGLHIGIVLATHYHGWGYIAVSDLSWHYTVAHNAGILAWWLIIVVLVTTIARMVIDRQTWLVMHRTIPFLILLFGTIHAFFASANGFSWPILIPAVAALTFIASVGITRWNTTRSRQRKVTQ